MNLKNLKVTELTKQEMKSIEGGGFFGRVWNWLKRSIGIGGREGEVYAEVALNF